MNRSKLTRKANYHSPLREAQAQATREKITEAGMSFFQRTGGQEELTFKKVAKEAGVTEMTVFRHFPTREDLLDALWKHLSQKMNIQFPETLDEVLGINRRLFQAFESQGGILRAGMSSKEGREIEKHVAATKNKAFLKIAADISPKMSSKKKKQVAAILAHLQSPQTWDALSSYWDMNSDEIADAAQFAIEALVSHAQKKEKV